MISEGIRQLCGLSVLCGVALSLAPKGSVRKAASVCCTVLLLLSVLHTVTELDLSVYSVELARYREMGRELAQGAQESGDRLNRLVIERECEEYIQSRATAAGIELSRVEVTARWDTEGFWVPDSVRLEGRADSRQKAELGGLIRAELGIGPEKQEWVTDGG